MKNISDEEFAKVFESADDATKALMYSPHIYEASKKILTQMNLAVNPSSLLLPIAYNVLGLLSPDEATEELAALGIKNGAEFLVQIKNELKNNETTQQPEIVSATEIEETEKELESLQNIRTMAADMQEVRAQVPTYQSAQSDLIRPSAPLPPAHSGPHWETDSN
jgi:hypothetical protein